MKQMKRTEYLYGISAKEFADMPYRDALKYKIQKAKELLRKVTLEADKYFREGANYDNMQQAFYRQREILEAIQFNEKLLKELEEKD